MKMTIPEIAQKAGVSIATISRAANPQTRDKVAPATLQKLDHLFKKYSYTPNIAARNLRQSSTKTIGVVVPFYRDIFYSAYYMHILAGVSNTLEGSGYQFKLLALNHELKWDHYDFRSGEQVDGLIISLWFRFFSNKDVLKKIKVPAVVMDNFETKVKTRFICGDHLNGGKIAAEYLYSCGHRNLAVITGPDWSRDSHLRVKGFKDQLKTKGIILDPGSIVSGEFLKDKAKNAIDQILAKNPGTTAVFCCTDIMASGALERLQELKIACPKDISVIGYDDDFMVINRLPFLTTIHVPVYDMAAFATQEILEHLKNKHKRNTLVGCELMNVHLVDRGSVRRV